MFRKFFAPGIKNLLTDYMTMTPCKDKPVISVVVPVYLNQGSLNELSIRLTDSLESINPNFEVVFVDDGSPDDSWSVIKECTLADKRFRGIRLSRNFGQHVAITAGLNHARGEWIVVMDADLQDQPEDILNLYKKALEGHDIVVGKRDQRDLTFIRKVLTTLFYRLISFLTSTDIDSTVANFGIYHRKVIDVVISMKERFRFFPLLVRWVGFPTASIWVSHAKRSEGKSAYTYCKLASLAVDVMISFSDKALRLLCLLGLLISAMSGLYAIYTAVRVLFHDRVVLGWASVFTSLWFLVGLIIFLLGVVGVYVGRIFDEVKARPLFVIWESTDVSDA